MSGQEGLTDLHSSSCGPSDSLRPFTSTSSTSRFKTARRRSIGTEPMKPLVRRVSLSAITNSSMNLEAILSSKHSCLKIDLELHSSDPSARHRSASISHRIESRTIREQRELPWFSSISERGRLPDCLDSPSCLTRRVSESLFAMAKKEGGSSSEQVKLQSEVEESAQRALIERNMQRMAAGELTLKQVTVPTGETRKVTQVSQRLLASKRDSKADGRIKAKPLSRVEKELEEKISDWRFNGDELQERVQKHREILTSKAPVKLFVPTRNFRPGNLEAIRTSRSQKYKEKRDLAMKLYKESLQKSAEDIVAVLQVKEQKRLAFQREALVVKQRQKEMAIARLLLPAVIAAYRLHRWRQILELQGAIREKMLLMQGAALRLQRFMKWRFWYWKFKNSCVLKKVFRKYMWKALMAHRIRKKSNSAAVVVIFLRDSLRTPAFRQVIQAFRYKILVVQRQLRRIAALKTSLLRMAQKQYEDVVHQQQVHGSLAPVSSPSLSARAKPAGSKKPAPVSSPTGTNKDVRRKWNSINFYHMPCSSSRLVELELNKLLSSRRRAFAEDLHEWRQERNEWLREKKDMFAAEDQAMDLVSRITKKPSKLSLSLPKRSTKDPEAPWLLTFEGTYTWRMFLGESEEDRRRNPRYRKSGPPRPLYDVNLDVQLELLPVLLRIFRESAESSDHEAETS